MKNEDYYVRGVKGNKPTNKISQTTKLILKAAKYYGIKYERILYTGIYKLSYQDKNHYIHPGYPANNSRTTEYCCVNKEITANLLRIENINVADGYVITKDDPQTYWIEIYNKLSKPLVIKPNNSSLSNNVFININTQKEYLSSIKKIKSSSVKSNQKIIVEEMYEKAVEYRIIATPDKVIGIMARVAANVVGDGMHTIEELVDIKNQNPLRGSDKNLKKLSLGSEQIKKLEKQNVSISYVPKQSEQIWLNQNSSLNIDNGGDTIDLTDTVHPSVNKIAMKAVQAIPGLKWAGIDYMSKDINSLQEKSNYSIIEINSSPNIAWQEFPAIGKRRFVAREYIRMMFPDIQMNLA